MTVAPQLWQAFNMVFTSHAVENAGSFQKLHLQSLINPLNLKVK